MFTEEQPYDRTLPQFNRYMERLSYISTVGERVCETGLYYPICDFQSGLNAEETAEAFDTLEKNEAERAEAELEDALVQKVVDAADCDIPQAMIDDEVTTMLREMEMRMAYQGLRFADYLKYTGQTEDQVREQYKGEATNRVKTQLVLEAIAKAEGIEATDEDHAAAIEDQAKRMGRPADEFKASLSEGQLDYLRETAAIKKTIDFLKANAAITEKKAEAPEATAAEPKPAKKAAKKAPAKKAAKKEEKPAEAAADETESKE